MGARFSALVQTGPGAHPTSCIIGTGYFPGVKSGRGVMLTPHPLLMPWSSERRAIPLLHLQAVRPVQSLSACVRVPFTFSFLYTPYRGSTFLTLTQDGGATHPATLLLGKDPLIPTKQEPMWASDHVCMDILQKTQISCLCQHSNP